MPYSLATRCIAETLATFVAIFLGTGTLANDILPHAKGRGMGFAWSAAIYCFSFSLAILMFGHVSAFLNPALCVALAIRGDVAAWDAVALIVCEVVGAFLAGCGVYLMYWPHFWRVPRLELADQTWGDNTPTGLGISGLGSDTVEGPPNTPSTSSGNAESPISLAATSSATLTSPSPTTASHFKSRKRSPPAHSPAAHTFIDLPISATADAEIARLLHADQVAKLTVFCTRPAFFPSPLPAPADSSPSQNLVFLHALLVELSATTLLITGALLIDDRVGPSTPPPTSALLKGLLLTVLVIALGGPTGFAANPARTAAGARRNANPREGKQRVGVGVCGERGGVGRGCGWGWVLGGSEKSVVTWLREDGQAT
ncbi:hypothetical protein HDU96_004839 [Phlyctochytrium bullatum]|nr:hypothetical protein HDU96_004839 [Phlyctochytrium bullatum]